MDDDSQTYEIVSLSLGCLAISVVCFTLGAVARSKKFFSMCAEKPECASTRPNEPTQECSIKSETEVDFVL